ncbi:hypothetical protein Dimus_027570 [Dionaea muscipula]
MIGTVKDYKEKKSIERKKGKMGSASQSSSIDVDDDTLAYASVLVESLAVPMVLHTAMQLDLFEIIAENGPLSAAEIAGKLPSQNPEAPAMLDRMLRMLAAYSVVKCSVVGDDRRVYGLAPVAKHFVRNDDGVSFCPFMDLLNDRVCVESWFKLKESVLEGGTAFDKAHGMHTFELLRVDQRFNQVFSSAMFNHTTIVMRKVIESYKGFEDIKQLVDVGGGVGSTLKVILSQYPYIKGINFDLPHVVVHAPPHSGIEHVSGDMFASIPSGDAILMKWILHDWDDEHCITLLKNCYKALTDDGKVIVYEALVSEEAETSVAAKATSVMDMIMLSQTPRGKERTQKEFLALAIASGFTGIKLICRVCGMWVMEFFK